MLGTIAKKLRMFGFDCKYNYTMDDDELILTAKKQGRIIITKDSQLAKNAVQHDIVTIKIDTHIEKEQLVEIAQKIGYKKFDLSYSRCSLCNGTLEETSKEKIQNKVPPRIIQSIDKFWQCQKCLHIYWVGTHIRNMEKLITEINAKI